MKIPEGNAIIYCEGAYNTTSGKTAHGLVRYTSRYKILSVIDATCHGQDAGMVLDGIDNGIPILKSLDNALKNAKDRNLQATHLVIGISPVGERLNHQAKKCIKEAMFAGLDVDSGLHDYLLDDDDILRMAINQGVKIRDIKKPKAVKDHCFFTGRIKEVSAHKIAVLGTDSSVGKRTTARLLTNDFVREGIKVEMIGTGQTSWMQGFDYTVILNSILRDFVSGELENIVLKAWQEAHPEIIIIEGQGSLLNPAYPGGFEIIAATRPDAIIMQHAPMRKDYDGFPGHPIHDLKKQIKIAELVSGKKVIAITINHENLSMVKIDHECRKIYQKTGIPAFDVLYHGTGGIRNIIKKSLKELVV